MKKNRYQIDYENFTDCFWQREPAKYVKFFYNEIARDLKNYKVLDLGAGEGKNAVFLASKGACVTAVDLSSIALSRFSQQPNYNHCKDKINTIESDVRTINFNTNEFDLIIAYGIFHALENIDEIYKLINKSMIWLKSGGYYIIATFTNDIPPPKIQNYLEFKAFVNYKDLINSIENTKNIIYEHDIITEIHPTSNIEHKHSIARLIIQKL
jgi:tellurite methyltransferase